MLSRRRLLAIGLGLSLVLLATVGRHGVGANMHEVRFDLGGDIYNTAKQSGVPEFNVQKVASSVVYNVSGVPPEVAFRYVRPGFEIVWSPLFSFSLYADEQRGQKVDAVTLQLSNKAFDATPPQSDAEHRLAQAFVEQTIAQFQRGGWQRYAEEGWQVMLTGRSSYLDESGNIAPDATWSMDPLFRIPQEDWPKVVNAGTRWRWVGDGVLATLSVRYTSTGVAGFPPYKLTLEFETLDVKLKQEGQELARRLKEGDAKGWNSTTKHEAAQREAKARNKRLIENALKRGDAVVPFPEKY